MKLQKGLLIVQIDNTIFGSWVKIIIHVLYKGNEKVAKEKIRIHGLIFSVRRPKQISLSCRKRVRPQYKAARGLLIQWKKSFRIFLCFYIMFNHLHCKYMSYFKEVWFACAILLSPSCSLPALLESVGATFLTQLIFASA